MMFLLSSLLLCTPVLGHELRKRGRRRLPGAERYRPEHDIEYKSSAYVTITDDFHGFSSCWQGIKGIYMKDQDCKIVRFRDYMFDRDNKDFSKAIVSPKYKDEKIAISFMVDVRNIKVSKADQKTLFDFTSEDNYKEHNWTHTYWNGKLPTDAFPSWESCPKDLCDTKKACDHGWSTLELPKPIDERTKTELGLTPLFKDSNVRRGKLINKFVFHANKWRLTAAIIKTVKFPKNTSVRILRFCDHKNKSWNFIGHKKDHDFVWVHAHGITFRIETALVKVTEEDLEFLLVARRHGLKFETYVATEGEGYCRTCDSTTKGKHNFGLTCKPNQWKSHYVEPQSSDVEPQASAPAIDSGTTSCDLTSDDETSE